MSDEWARACETTAVAPDEQTHILHAQPLHSERKGLAHRRICRNNTTIRVRTGEGLEQGVIEGRRRRRRLWLQLLLGNGHQATGDVKVSQSQEAFPATIRQSPNLYVVNRSKFGWVCVFLPFSHLLFVCLLYMILGTLAHWHAVQISIPIYPDGPICTRINITQRG